jgi:hypothetical protein
MPKLVAVTALILTTTMDVLQERCTGDHDDVDGCDSENEGANKVEDKGESKSDYKDDDADPEPSTRPHPVNYCGGWR